MKRKFWLVMVITVTTVARAYDFGFQAENGKNLFFNYLGGDSVAIVKGSSNYSGQIIVPETVLDSVGDTYRVTSVGANAFYNSLNITYLSLPTSINHIGNNAFCSAIFTEAGYYNWRPIAVLDLPNLKTIENYAFAQASMIRALYAPNVTYIGAYAFRDAYNLRHCVLSDNVQIGAETFNSAMYLSEFDIPKSQVTIAKQTFSACWLLKRLGIPEGVKYIRAKAFSACMSLESLVFPESVDSIGSQVIYGNDWQHAMGAWGLICEDSIDFALTTGCRYAQYNTSNRLKSLYFKGTTPPRLAPDAFVNVIKSNVTCYVPAEAKKEYESASDSLYYKSFNKIVGISYGNEGDVDVQANYTTADFIWQSMSDMIEEYHIKILDKGALFAEYRICVNGMQITCAEIVGGSHQGTEVKTKSVRRIPKQVQDTTYSDDDMYVLTIEGLSPGTDYNYSIEGIGTNMETGTKETIWYDEGKFRTKQQEVVTTEPNIVTNDADTDGLLTITDGTILFQSTATAFVSIYNSQGILLYRSCTTDCSLSLPSGLYIIKINNKSSKVIL